jgi:hypothetical protein
MKKFDAFIIGAGQAGRVYRCIRPATRCLSSNAILRAGE